MTLNLVTGGTGYLGRHVVDKLLADGRQVRVLARKSSDVTGLEGAEIVRGDITERAALERALDGASRVFHMAAETRDDQSTELYEAVNHHAVTALLELASARGVERFLHTSHYYALGRSGEPRSVKDFVNDECWTHDPGDMHDAHEASKNDAENSVNQRVSLGEPVLALIPTRMYGPEARPVKGVQSLSAGNRIVRMLADHAAGHYAGIPGDGTQLWNLAHVEDVAAAHLLAMDSSPDGGVWPPARFTQWHYICGGENVRLAQLFQQFGQLAQVAPPPLAKGPRKGLLGRLFGGGAADGPGAARHLIDSHSWAYSTEMAATVWGYQHRPLAQGLEQTVAWMGQSGLLG